MDKDKDKWSSLIEYLKTTNAKPESVLNLIKNTWKPKGKTKIKTDDFNIVRRAWTLMVVHGIYNKHGTPKKHLKNVMTNYGIGEDPEAATSVLFKKYRPVFE